MWAWFFSTAKGVYAIHTPLAYTVHLNSDIFVHHHGNTVHLHVRHFCTTSYFQTRRAEIPSLKGFLFYLMRHFPPSEDALLPFDRHRPQRNSRFPRLFERKRSFRLFLLPVGYNAALSHGAFLAKRRRDNLRRFFYASIALSNCYISIKNRIR